jgi:hypothetical protein
LSYRGFAKRSVLLVSHLDDAPKAIRRLMTIPEVNLQIFKDLYHQTKKIR